MDFQQLRDQLPAINNYVYLNTGTSGPVPQTSAQRAVELLMRTVDEGFAVPNVTQAYMAALADARAAIARSIGASPEEIALTHSTSDGIGIVASGLSWHEGDEVIVSDLEHISGIGPWEQLQRRFGVKVVWLQSENGNVTAQQFQEAITDKTRLICVSHISYATGALLPISEICDVARQAGVLVLVDGAQAVGHIPVDVGALGCDFYAIPGQKWLLGPEGTGGLYVRRDAMDMIDPGRVGWASYDFKLFINDEFELYQDARRFETGTMHSPAFAGLVTSIEMLEAIGWDAIEQRAAQLSQMAAQRLGTIPGVRVISPMNPPTGLLTFEVPGQDPEHIVRKLWRDHRVIIRTIPKLSALRASFHAFNSEDDVDRLIYALSV